MESFLCRGMFAHLQERQLMHFHSAFVDNSSFATKFRIERQQVPLCCFPGLQSNQNSTDNGWLLV